MNNYLQAARVLDGVLARKGSIKTLALRSEIANKVYGRIFGIWDGGHGPWGVESGCDDSIIFYYACVALDQSTNESIDPHSPLHLPTNPSIP